MAHQAGSTESPLTGTSSVLSNDSLWIPDSGATDHMVSSPTILTQSYPVHGRTVPLPNGSYASTSPTQDPHGVRWQSRLRSFRIAD